MEDALAFERGKSRNLKVTRIQAPRPPGRSASSVEGPDDDGSGTHTGDRSNRRSRPPRPERLPIGLQRLVPYRVDQFSVGIAVLIFLWQDKVSWCDV